MKNLFEQHESEVRSYCRNFPAVFTSAKGAWMTDQDGRRYLDFFAGAGVMNCSATASPTRWTCTAPPNATSSSASSA
jgi:diaminobutyrate-2-oxoglutarate transaminase